jgi:F-type H+-transporting ATPase subunit gamma
MANLKEITKAMKMVSAAKLKRATDSITQLKPYANKLQEILANLSGSAENIESPFTQTREVKKVLIVVVTSNRGLCGGFNSSVIKGTNRLIAEKYAKQHAAKAIDLVCIGKKGADFFRKLGYTIIGDNNKLVAQASFEGVGELANQMMDWYSSEKYDAVEIVYNQFKNAAVQVLSQEPYLPIQPSKSTSTTQVDYIFEPTQEEIVTNLIPKALRIQLYKAVIDSIASEHGARMTAMDKATENAGELLKQLKLSYNQARQAAITTEILEIVSGANALSGG